MKRTLTSLIALGFLGTILFTSCQSGAIKSTHTVTGKLAVIDSTWDNKTDAQLIAELSPYKEKVDSVMNQVIGEASTTLTTKRPESLLSNLVADVLREAATPYIGHPADMGLVNMGGLRTIITEGKITKGNIYEILPFENSLCILTLQGKHIKMLMQNIAAVHGEGVSNIQLQITETGEVINAKINGESIQDEKRYTVATIDYLAGGNDGMEALIQAEDKICPQGATLRGLFLDYVKSQTEQNKKITSRLENRITIIEK
mgnify:FL=1